MDLYFDQHTHSSTTSNQRTQQTDVNYAGLNREDTSTNSPACTSAKPIRFQNAAVNLANREIFPSCSPIQHKRRMGELLSRGSAISIASDFYQRFSAESPIFG
ncbi:8198_t:CDS:2, partial [Paraglomus brasilianum]